jgi:hypothetical protein
LWRSMLRHYKQFLSLCRVLQSVSLHRVERVRGIRKSPRRKMLLQLPQKCVTLIFAGEFNWHTAFVVRRLSRRRTKFAATYSTQPW